MCVSQILLQIQMHLATFYIHTHQKSSQIRVLNNEFANMPLSNAKNSQQWFWVLRQLFVLPKQTIANEEK